MIFSLLIAAFAVLAPLCVGTPQGYTPPPGLMPHSPPYGSPMPGCTPIYGRPTTTLTVTVSGPYTTQTVTVTMPGGETVTTTLPGLTQTITSITTQTVPTTLTRTVTVTQPFPGSENNTAPQQTIYIDPQRHKVKRLVVAVSIVGALLGLALLGLLLCWRRNRGSKPVSHVAPTGGEGEGGGGGENPFGDQNRATL